LKKAALKILIIRFSSIGDIVLTSPVIRCLKQQVPGVEIHYLTKKSFQTVLKNNPYIDKLHLLEDSLSPLIYQLKAEKFDHIVDLHRNLRTMLLKSRLGIKSSSFDKLNVEKWLLVNFKINILPPLHIVDRYLKTVEFLGVKNDDKGLDYFLEKDYSLTELLPESHRNYTGVAIGAQHFTKRLPVYKLIEVCKLLDHPVVLMGGKEDAERADEIAKGAGEHVFNACGKFTLDESAYLVKMSMQIITHDTGLMHIAAAFNKPIISIWGNTVPGFGMYPYQVTESKIIEVAGLKCRPCSKIGFQKCPLGHFKCMNEQDPAQIVNFNFDV